MKSFFSTNEEKISDKAFRTGVVVSLISIVLCIVFLCSASYAWFSTNTSSGQNLLQGGSFDLDVAVTDGEGALVPVTKNDNGTQFCVLDAGAYTVALSMTADSTATKGYCDVKVGDLDAVQTATVSSDPAIGVSVLSFVLAVDGDGTIVLFTPKWGLPAFATIGDGATVGELGETDGDESDAIAESDSESETEPEGLTETQPMLETELETPEGTPEGIPEGIPEGMQPEAESEQESEF